MRQVLHDARTSGAAYHARQARIPRAESLSLLDRAKISYAERLEAGGGHSEVTITGSEKHYGSPCLPEGWAGWESAKPRQLFNSKQKRYLEETFQHGETTRAKANPEDVSKELKCLRDENGKRIFTVEEFLYPQQICSFFSRMASKRRDATDSDHEAEVFVRQQAAVHSDVMEALQQEITHPLPFSRKNLCLIFFFLIETAHFIINSYIIQLMLQQI